MKRLVVILSLSIAYIWSAHAQLNTDRLTAIGRNALYFEDYVLSIQYFNQVIKVKPYLAEPYLYRAIAKIQLADYKGAERDCSIAIQQSPFMPGLYYTRGFTYRQTGELQKAYDDFTQALLFAPENRTYMLLRADVSAQLKQYDKALEDINFLLKKEPNSAQLNFEKGIIQLECRDTIGALSCMTKAIENDSQNASNWSARGHINLISGNDNEALLDLTKAINLGSKWAGDYINRGIIFYKKHNYRGALADYDKAVEYDKQNSQCYYNRALLRQEVGDYNRALDDYNRALDLEPENTEIHYQRGLVNLQLAQFEDAVEDFKQLIERYPYFLPSYYLAAQAYNSIGDKKEAFRYQQKAKQLEDDKERLQKEKQTIDTDAKVAEAQPQRNDNRKQFSQRAAQNQTETSDEMKYETETRGAVQNRYADVVNEPSIQLTYYNQSNNLRRTNYFHYLVDEYNKTSALPSPLHLTSHELPLTAELANTHFEAIDRLSYSIEQSGTPKTRQDSITVSNLYFARAMESALVQDYSSAIDDCTKAIVLHGDFSIAFFCRANWRQKLAEYSRINSDVNEADTEQASLESKYGGSLILRDYDYVITLTPDFSFAYYNKANILCIQRDFKTAIRYYTDAIKCDGDFAEAYFNRGLTYIYIGETEKGINDLSKAGELGIYQAYNLITRFK